MPGIDKLKKFCRKDLEWKGACLHQLQSAGEHDLALGKIVICQSLV